MFESDDWDLDKDFLDDVDAKATQFYSQADNEIEDEPVKRRKIESFSDSSFSNSLGCNDWNKQTKAKKHDADAKNISRTNLILSMFNKNGVNKDASRISNNAPEKISKNSATHTRLASSQDGDNKPRKNLILGILQRRNEAPTSQSASSNAQGSGAKISHETETKANNYGATNYGENKTFQKPHTSVQPIPNNRQIGVKKHVGKESFPGDTRKELLLSALKPNNVNSTKSTTIEQKTKQRSASTSKALQAQLPKKMTLVRRFPGPAGLLPDDVDVSSNPLPYLNSSEENESEQIKDSANSNFPEYCSQDTKNLFTEGAWQLMLNDLPSNFLRGYEIATIKQTATANCTRNTKVEFLAGLLEYIDHSHDNPPIVLKDFTDSIRGILHRDIPLKYPGILEPNVVILLHDVGLLRTSGTLLSSKYHVLISPSSLMAIYSNKGKIVHTPNMRSLLGNRTLETSNDSLDEENTAPKKSHESLDDVFKDVGLLPYFEDTDDFFAVPSTDITNSQNQKNFSGLKPGEIRKLATPKKQPIPAVKQRSSEKKRESLLQTLKKFAPEQRTKKLLPVTKTESSVEYISGDSRRKKLEAVASDAEKMDVVETIETFEGGNHKNGTIKFNAETKQEHFSTNTKNSIRSRLLQFKSNDVLTPENSNEAEVQHLENTFSSFPKDKELSSVRRNGRSFEAMLCDSENDTDDEILSQLDVDTIFSNYNQEN